MKLLRPYIPLSVRVLVAERQIAQAGLSRKTNWMDWLPYRVSSRERLEMNLLALFGDDKFDLDHDPALENRQFNKRTRKYMPDANDPEFLVYRTKENHRIKTLVRGDGALRSDASQRRYLKKIARNREKQRVKWTKARRKIRWRSRPLRSESRWAPKGSRPFRSKRDG